MAEQKKEGINFGFGASSGGGSSNANPFGSSSGNAFGGGSNPAPGGLFGGGSNAPSGGLFGSASTPASGSLFGSSQPAASAAQPSAPTATTTSQSSPFGNFGGGASTGTPGGLFTTPNKPAESSGDQSTKPSFGSGLGGNLFGNASAAASSAPQGSTTPAQSNPMGLFGNPSTTPAGPPPSTGASTSSIFGNAGKSDGKPLFGSFGQQAASTSISQTTEAPKTTNTAPSNLFGGASTSSNLFGGSTNTGASATGASTPPTSSQPGQTSGLAGQSGGSKTQSSGLFGTQNTQSQSKSFFGNPTTTPASTSDSQSKPAGTQSLFGSGAAGQKSDSSSTPTGQPPGTSLFGGGASSGQNAPATTAPPAKPNFFGGSGATTASGPGLFAPTGSQSSATATSTTTAAATPSLFGGPSNKPAEGQPSSTAAPSSNLFAPLGGQAKNFAAETQSTTQGTSGATSTAAPAPSIFGGQQPAASLGTSQSGAQAPTNAKADDQSKGAAPGASTGGPKPAPASRLKNKSMDEIITRWASDLNKYQKEFQNQATQVAKWDQMLVENSDKIQKLYGHTLEAERATIEVERQLTAVENDQAELEYWLEHYEQQVNELMSKQVGQGDSLSGPDQERERTYKLAEKLSDRLDEMSKDLTAMVDEINDASSTLSKTSKADDPLSQIVRVLNGHLTQLQQIDQGTATLQAKVQAAQKASRQVGSSGSRNGLGGDAADDFYRSYMGRR